MSYKKKSCLGLSFALLYPKFLLLQDFLPERSKDSKMIKYHRSRPLECGSLKSPWLMTAFLEQPQARLTESWTAHIRGLEHITKASHFRRMVESWWKFFPHLNDKCVNKVASVSSAKYVTSWLQGEPTLLQKSHLNRFQYLDVESHAMDNDLMQWSPFSKFQPQRPCP